MLPGGELQLPVPHLDDTLLAVQPFHQSKQDHWPMPQLCKVQNNRITLKNSNNYPINLKNTKIQAHTLSDIQNHESYMG